MSVNESKTPNKYLFFIAYLYLAFMLADQVLMYRMVQIGQFSSLTAGVFLMPLYYFTGDMLAEVYGFRIARNLVYLVSICSIIFAVIISVLNTLPIPNDWLHRADYDYVFGRLMRSSIGGLFAVLSGSYINAYLISKLKVMIKGRFFIIRSVTSSALGEAVQMVIGCLLLFTGVIPWENLWKLMLELYIWQISLGALVATIGSILVRKLKQTEGEPLEQQVIFNPFKEQACSQ
ncbi:MAG: queuosine precursor transporter [Gammaproteobacteria bacterium]